MDVEKRLTAEKALEHPWLKSVLGEQKEQEEKVDPKILNLLRNFRSTAKFKKEALRVIVNQLNEKDIKNLKEAFRVIDKDNSGMISFEELRRVCFKHMNSLILNFLLFFILKYNNQSQKTSIEV